MPNKPVAYCVLHYSCGEQNWIGGYRTTDRTYRKAHRGRIVLETPTGGLLAVKRNEAKPTSEVLNPVSFEQVFGGHVVANKVLRQIEQRKRHNLFMEAA